MNLEINNKNYKNYIQKLHLNKKNDLLICMPTFNSYDITSQTIKSFYEQEAVDFDLMVIGPSGDIEKLSETYPQINYCITKENFGSSGNFLISIFITKNSEYLYTMLTDNDALLLDKDGISKLIEILNKDNLYLVTPVNSTIKLEQNEIDLETIPMVFHCALYSNKLFKELDYFFNANYFLCFDDISFFHRIKLMFPGKYRIANVRYYHSLKLEKCVYDLKVSYLYTRSFLNYLFREKLPLRVRFDLKFFPKKILPMLLIFLLKYRFSYVRNFLSAIYQVLKNDFNFNFFNTLKNKYRYELFTNPDPYLITEDSKFKEIRVIYDILPTPLYIKYQDTDQVTKYFKRIDL